MKASVPGTAKISKEAKECVQECVSEFISFITSEAAEKCQMEKRKTIGGEDILYAMLTLGFENYAETLKIHLAKLRQVRLRLCAAANHSPYNFEASEPDKQLRCKCTTRYRYLERSTGRVTPCCFLCSHPSHTLYLKAITELRVERSRVSRRQTHCPNYDAYTPSITSTEMSIVHFSLQGIQQRRKLCVW